MIQVRRWRVVIDDPDLASEHAFVVIAADPDQAERTAAMRAIVEDERGPGVALPGDYTPEEAATWRWFYASDSALVEQVAAYATTEDLGP